MPQFGAKSREQLDTCHVDLQHLAERVVETWDCSVRCGHRNQADQDAAFASGASDKKWPDGKHNALPSNAMDLYPYPVPTGKGATNLHYMFAGYVMGIAQEMGIDIRCGADWDGDRDITDQHLIDLVHFELRGRK